MYSIYVLTKVVISALYNLLAQSFFETEQNQKPYFDVRGRLFFIFKHEAGFEFAKMLMFNQPKEQT